MNNCSKLSRLFCCFVLSFVTAGAASAASFSGNFTSDNQVFQTNLTLTAPSALVAYTDSYATGGFVPVLSLFNQATGGFIALNGGNASCTNGRLKDATTGLCDDAYLSVSLSAGNYLIVLTQFYNFPNGNYSDGFSQAGTGNFTAAACNATGSFWQIDVNPCVPRSGSYALTITAASPVPEPATSCLLLGALAGVAVLYRKRRRIDIKLIAYSTAKPNKDKL